MSRLWLIGAIVVVVALVAGALIVALVTGQDAETFPAGSPEGTLQRYLLALDDGDYEEAYGYLSADLRARCSLQGYLRYAPETEMRDNQVTLKNTRTFDDTALVTASVSVFEPGVPFEANEYTYERTFELTRDDGEWRMSGPEWWCPKYPQ